MIVVENVAILVSSTAIVKLVKQKLLGQVFWRHISSAPDSSSFQEFNIITPLVLEINKMPLAEIES